MKEWKGVRPANFKTAFEKFKAKDQWRVGSGGTRKQTETVMDY